VADNFGPGGVYANIPRIDSHGRQQLPMFMRWNSDPVGNDATNLAALNPNLQKVVAQARADNPNLNFVIGNGKRSAADQDQAKAWGWSRVGSKDGGDANVHMQGNAVDLWGLDDQGRVQFDPGQQKQISQAMTAAAQKLGVGVNWGGNFKTFKDAPHFELARGGSAASSGAPEGPTASSGAPMAQPSSSSSSAPSGTTPNSSSVIDTLSRNIAGIESGGWKNPYDALGPQVGSRGRAIGKYQVMPENVPGWTQAALGHSETPEQFQHDPAAQEAVFRDQMQRNLQLYGPKDAASIWFTGKPYNVAGGASSDVTGTNNASYVARATAGLDGSTFTPNKPGTTINTTGSPTAATGATPAVPGALGAGGAGGAPGGLPGYQPGSPAEKMAQSSLKSLSGSTPEAQPMQLQPPQAAQAVGGPMMMRPGGQNVDGRMAAIQALAQQGFMTQPTLAANTPMPTQSPVASVGTASAMPGTVTGVPSLPGTTLNSPSALQMALMSGSFSPYDAWGRSA
jgi:D-alanyl-D-alanine carboxypeptidase